MVVWKVERRLPEKELNELMGKYHPLEWRTHDADMVLLELAAGKTDRHETYPLLLLRLQQSNITEKPANSRPLDIRKTMLTFRSENTLSERRYSTWQPGMYSKSWTI
jgi:hypothetical protein